MAIYNIFDYYDRESSAKSFLRSQAAIDPAMLGAPLPQQKIEEVTTDSASHSLMSAFAARLFFFILLIADVLWMVWTCALLTLKSALYLLTLGRIASLRASCSMSWLNFKRGIVSAIALIVALFSPALGIMFSCMYFLMYDREGVDEIVPSSLREQFRDIFPL